MHSLTPRQRKVLDAIEEIKKAGEYPSRHRIAALTGMKPANVYAALKELVVKGFVQPQRGLVGDQELDSDREAARAPEWLQRKREAVAKAALREWVKELRRLVK